MRIFFEIVSVSCKRSIKGRPFEVHSYTLLDMQVGGRCRKGHASKRLSVRASALASKRQPCDRGEKTRSDS